MSEKKSGKWKQFFSRLVANLDKKMEEKAKKGGCCDKNGKGGGPSCCR